MTSLVGARPTVVFFDVGGTLIEVSPSIGHVYAEACRRRGARVDPDSVQAAFDRAWVTLSSQVPSGRDRYSLFPGGESEWWARVTRHAFDQCDVPEACRPPAEELRATFARAEAWRVYPEAVEALSDLARRGIRLGVISNWDSRLPALLSALGLNAHFECVVSSAAAGYEKPHPAIFHAGLQALGVEPSRALHVGDRLEEDYEGAIGAGLQALLVDRRAGAMPREEVSRWNGWDKGWGNGADLVADLAEAVQRIAG